ncbi:MAG: ATP-binding protein [Flavobacteriales bacterium]|nr:ATP-binding protein [Flavobacteriales bacterium]
MEKRISKDSKRIAVLGPESSGKTTLCTYLEEFHDALVIKEFAREYLGNNSSSYSLNDLLTIAEQQFDSNERAQSDLVVCDTEMITMLIWASEKFGSIPGELEDLAAAQQFDHFLLCRPDISWEYDPLRENPMDRDRLFDLYLKALKNVQTPFSIVQGSKAERIRSIDSLLSSLH